MVDNIILLRVEKYSELDEAGIYSEKKEIHGFPWRLNVNRTGGLELNLSMFEYDKSNVWFCDASMECTLINQNEGGEHHILPTSVRHRFSPEVMAGFKMSLDKPNLLENPELGFIKDDTIIIEARVYVHGKEGNRFRKKIHYDMFSPCDDSDGTLVVEGMKVYVSKQLLSIQSSFFKSLFFGDFKEANEAESEINELDVEQFGVLLNILYRTGQSLNDDNVEFILKLADRFEMLSILDDVEKYLLTSKSPGFHEKFRLSDQYNLFVLQDQLLPKYTADLIRELNKSPDYGMLKEETKDLLFKKYIEFTTPK